jgi:hypothetical protein
MITNWNNDVSGAIREGEGEMQRHREYWRKKRVMERCRMTEYWRKKRIMERCRDTESTGGRRG